MIFKLLLISSVHHFRDHLHFSWSGFNGWTGVDWKVNIVEILLCMIIITVFSIIAGFFYLFFLSGSQKQTNMQTNKPCKRHKLLSFQLLSEFMLIWHIQPCQIHVLYNMPCRLWMLIHKCSSCGLCPWNLLNWQSE